MRVGELGWRRVRVQLLLFDLVLIPALLGLWSFQRRKLLAALLDRAERERDLLAERAVVD